ncbi:unnamed protein product [Rotaria socialis]|uniref:Dynamin N-terminal domain-containing protein n=3 Tax=Rotaria socialis TaxID=392032 RepID=A0A818CQ25_9BILA|nr:unnamed protein product [Rotaria socialis]CAF3435644.1 unnamed protein product [Rotaria socialis]CAF3445967.1 unnamed protein product [Rotaria socialis]CAF3522098.1 unnamed protein product [Rotaria socialis]CAF4265535.1 unnamed protein product [Rotaria socialis]
MNRMRPAAITPNPAVTTKSPATILDGRDFDVSSSILKANMEMTSSTDEHSDVRFFDTALKSACEQGDQSASKAADQIEADKNEARQIIANHAVDPLEMLHLVDHWIQQLLGEFLQKRDHFKYKLKEKWEKQELFVNHEHNNKTRTTYFVVKGLQEALNGVLSRSSFEETTDYITKLECKNHNVNELKEKFNELSEQYFKIIDSLEYIDRETKGYNIHIKSLRDSLMTLKALNDKVTHTICIIGLEKAGKSTFINALTGFELLPTASERCTQIRTVLKPPLQNQLQRFATITYYNDQEFKIYFDKMVKKTDESNEQFERRKREVIEEREVLKTKFPQEHFDVNAYDMKSNEAEKKRVISSLHNYIKGELYVNIIKEISIYTDKLPGENYELLDVPGFDSPIKEHRDAGLRAIATADAFLFLSNGQSPSLTDPQICLLHEIQTHHYEAMQRAFGILTKLDLCSTRAIYLEHYEKCKGELIDKLFNPSRIFAACPRLELLEEGSDEYRAIDGKLRHFDNLKNGFELAKAALNAFIEYELPKTHLNQLLDLGKTRLFRFVNEALEIVRQKQLLPENLAIMSIDEYLKVHNTEHWDRYYYEDRFKPTFAKANEWHSTIVTRDRSKFINDTKQKFHDCFLELTKEFMQPQQRIDKLMYEVYGYTKLILNAHPPDNIQREKLSFELESIVDKTSDHLAQHFYHSYVCELESILNEISPEEKDLYRTKLSLEQCRYEVHALIFRICRPVIMAALRYSRSDFHCKEEAIRELIYIAPIVAYKIVNDRTQDKRGELALMIPNLAELLLKGGNGTCERLIQSLFVREE